MSEWPVFLVGALLALFGVGSSYQSYVRNATAPLERRTGRFESLFPGLAFTVAGVIVLVVVTGQMV